MKDRSGWSGAKAARAESSEAKDLAAGCGEEVVELDPAGTTETRAKALLGEGSRLL